MDAEAIEALDGRYYYGFAAALALGALTVVLFVGAAAVAVATDQRTEAVGHLVAAVGWCLVLGSVARWSPAFPTSARVADPVFLAGFGLTALGGATSLLADRGERLRAVAFRPE